MAYGASAQAWDTARSEGDVVSLKMGAEKIYKGTMVDIDATGYAVQVAETASLVFAGVADETVDNSAGLPGAKRITVRCSGCHKFKSTGLGITDIGELAYADLANTDAGQRVLNSATAAKELAVGRFVGVDSATLAVVKIDGFALGSGVAPLGVHGLDD